MKQTWKSGSITLLIFILFLLSGPANAQQDIDTNNDIEKWKGKKPALILKENKTKVITGKIIKVDENGVIFDPKKESLFYNPPQKFYSFDEIETLVGNNGKYIINQGKRIGENYESAQQARRPTQRSKSSKSRSKKSFSHKFRFNAEYGYSSLRIKPEDNIDPIFKDYVNELKSGSNFSMDVCCFVSYYYGVGLVYSNFSTSGFIDGIYAVDITTGRELGPGRIEDNITVSFIGPAFFERKALIPQKLLLISNIAIGRISYVNDGTIITEPVTIKGNTIGFSGAIGLDFFIAKDFAIGIDFSYLIGKIGKYKINNQTVDLEEDESMNRWDFNIGLKYYL